MEKQLNYEFIEYSSSNTQALYLRKPLTVEELKRTYPLLKGIVFEFGRSTFEPLRYDHQAYLMEVLQAFDFQEVMIDSVGRLTHLPDTLWKPSLKKLELGRHNCNFPVQPPPGFKNNLDAIALRNSDYIDPSIFDTPTLHYAEITAYKGELSGLSKALNLEKLYLSNTEASGLDFSQFTHLTHLQLHVLQQAEYLPDFSALQNLKELRLLNIQQLQVLPKGIETLRNLQSLYCNYLGNAESPEIPFPFSVLPNLAILDIANCNFDFSKSQSLKVPVLATLRFMDAFAASIPEFMLSPALEKCWLYMSALQELPSTFWQCTQLKEFTLSNNHIKNFGTGWDAFSDLESLSIESADAYDQLPDFGKANTALHTIQIKATALNSLPASWCECPALHTIRIDAKPGELPDAWAHFPALKHLKIRWVAEEPLFVRKEVALLTDLQSLNIECKSPLRDLKLVQSLNATLTKFKAERPTRLVFGHLLLENSEKAESYSDDFKTDFLQAVNIGSGPLKQVVWDNLYLLNPDRGAFSALRQFENKSLFIAGGTRLKKADYKEKLEAMGMKVVAKLSADVDFILLGNACPDLPEGFWAKPHWFCGEIEMDKVLKEYQPGFMQTLPENDLDALRRLIWSNDPANERVVLEMLKKGGIPDDVIPDLVVVAKTSIDQAIRNDFRKLLKAKAPEDMRAVLSNTRDLDKILERARYAYQRPAGISQMVVAHYYRSKNKELLPNFFRYRESLENPYRAALFQDLYPSFLQRPHYLSLNEMLFSEEELNRILNEPALQGVLKRLLIRCAGEALPAALFKHNSLNELKIYTDIAHVPKAIGDLKRLKNLEVSGKNLRSVPDSLLQIKSLKYLLFASSLSPNNWEISEALQTARGGNSWMQQRNFDYLD